MLSYRKMTEVLVYPATLVTLTPGQDPQSQAHYAREHWLLHWDRTMEPVTLRDNRQPNSTEVAAQESLKRWLLLLLYEPQKTTHSLHLMIRYQKHIKETEVSLYRQTVAIGPQCQTRYHSSHISETEQIQWGLK